MAWWWWWGLWLWSGEDGCCLGLCVVCCVLLGPARRYVLAEENGLESARRHIVRERRWFGVCDAAHRWRRCSVLVPGEWERKYEEEGEGKKRGLIPRLRYYRRELALREGV
jgi:hypothetical protein